MVDGYSTGSTPAFAPTMSSPYPAVSTFLYFTESGGPSQTNPATPDTNTGTPVLTGSTGTPVLTGSNGTTLTGGTLIPIENSHLQITTLYGYSSSISGLLPNVSYSVSFSALQGVQAGCNYGGQSAGSFSTN